MSDNTRKVMLYLYCAYQMQLESAEAAHSLPVDRYFPAPIDRFVKNVSIIYSLESSNRKKSMKFHTLRQLVWYFSIVSQVFLQICPNFKAEHSV